MRNFPPRPVLAPALQKRLREKTDTLVGHLSRTGTNAVLTSSLLLCGAHWLPQEKEHGTSTQRTVTNLNPSRTPRTLVLARSRSAPADRIARAKEILAVAEGQTVGQAAHHAGRTSRQAVARLVRRFDQEGMAAVAGHHGGGPAVVYGTEEQARILQEFPVRPIGSKIRPLRGVDGLATCLTACCGWSA